MTRILVLIITISSFLSTQPTTAQQNLLYDSIVNIDGELYHGKFEYYINKKDTIYNGSFDLTQQIEEISNNNSFSISSVKGEFNKNTPVEEWIIRKGEFTPTERGALKDYSYTFKINGNELLTRGFYNNGNKLGPWEIYEWEIANSTIQDTLLYGKIPYDSNSISGEINFFNRGQYLNGSVQNQLADGSWLFYTTDGNGNKKLTKEWQFRNNILVKKLLYQNGQELELEVGNSANSSVIIEEMQISKKYFSIIDLQSSINNPELYKKYDQSKRVESLFFKIINELKGVDSIFYPISNDKITPHLKAKIQRIPYEDEEKKLLTAIQENANKSSDLIRVLQEDVQVNLAKLSTSQVAFYISTAEAIQQRFLSDILNIIYHFEEGNMEYISRELLIELGADISNKLEVKQYFNDDSSTVNYTFKNYNVDEKSNATKKLKVFTDDILLELNTIKDSIDSYVQEIKMEEDLSEIESVLFRKYEEMKTLADSLISEQNNDIAGFDVKEAVIDYLDETLKYYSGLASTEEKNQAIEYTLKCLSNTENLIKTLEKAPENYYTIRDAYTREVFNPYTYTNMQEKIKPGIYKSFEEDILPAVYGKIKSMNCKNLESYTKNFKILFEGMLTLLQKETDKLERKVKRARDAKKAADLIGFQLKI